MQAQSTKPIKTFTIGFEEDSYNEAPYASAVSHHLNTEHTEVILSAQDAMAVIPRLPSIYDEPFADASQIPTLLVSELARRQVTVSLSGDGGDELFGGYSRHLWGQTVWNRMNRFPLRLRRAASATLKSISPLTWDGLFTNTRGILPQRIRQRNPGDKLAKLADAIVTDSPEAMYSALVSGWKDPASVVLNADEPPIALTDRLQWANLADFTERMLFLDTVSYLPDDILVKVDRASMSESLEAREPLLDHRVLEFAWSLPLSMKIRNGQGKWLLRQVAYKYVPPSLIDRPKAGFGVPINSWLRGPLRDWAEDLLAEDVLRRQGFLNPHTIRAVWQEHLAGRRNCDAMLWHVLMFQAWEANK
jgi:asparagine synthase (glutamine-hydrolysing)